MYDAKRGLVVKYTAYTDKVKLKVAPLSAYSFSLQSWVQNNGDS